MSAGQFMAGRPDCVLVTVTTADPPRHVGLSDYDRSCGFASSAEAMAVRRAEDGKAARILSARTTRLPFADGQYGTPLDPEAVAVEIREELVRTGSTMLLGPLGLAHPDHEATAAAVLVVASSHPDVEVWMYEELPARVLWPETVPPALGRVRDAGFEPVLSFCGTGPLDAKLKAVRAYRSQLGALTRATAGAGLHPVLCPERFHLLRPTGTETP